MGGGQRQMNLERKLDELVYALYGLTTEELRVLKEKEQAKFGEYRTRRLVLEAWNKLG